MPLSKVMTVTDPKMFYQTLHQCWAKEKDYPRFPFQIFVLFFSSNDSQTGRPWCPDCEDAEVPIQDEILNSALIDDGILIKCIMTRQDYKDNPEFAYKKDAVIQLSRIPTLLHWPERRLHHPLRLVERDCADPVLLRQFLESSIGCA